MSKARRRVAGRPIIVHHLAHARAALKAAAELGVPVTLRSPPGAGAYLGSPYFRAMIDAARREFPAVAATAVLDCGDAPGYALGALRMGIKVVRVRVRPAVRRKLAEIAAQLEAQLDGDRRKALDLLDVRDPEAACRVWLGPSLQKVQASAKS